VVSNTFDMGEWKPDESATIPGCNSWCTAHLWIVPAKAAGIWTLPDGELTLKQNFQMISGTLKSAKGTIPVEGRLNGAQMSFTAGGISYSGRVNGDIIEGSPGTMQWNAKRAQH
jgi:hypothetical protein